MGELSSILSSHCQGGVPQWRVGGRSGMVGTSAVSGVVGDTSWLVMVLEVVAASVLAVLGADCHPHPM